MHRVLLALSALAACAPVSGRDSGSPGIARPPVVLVSLDGFRWDYLDRGITPALARLAAEGVRARGLVPVFPTKTFPNHYTLVTGLYPAAHGVVGNVFTAPELADSFSLHDRTAVRDARFWGGEPIWVTAERQGLRTAPDFWPGSEAPIGGVRPTWWLPYEHERPAPDRVRQVIERLALPATRRPAFVTLYLNLVDDAGHTHGPDAVETDSAIARADAVIGQLVAGLEPLGPVNLVIVSDHGMAGTSPERTLWLDDYVDRDWLRYDELSPVLMAWPAPGREQAVIERLRASPRLTVYRRSELPAAYRLAGSPRVAPVVAIADEGWTIAWRPAAGAAPAADRGAHGYPDSLASMWGIFLAHGPAFRRGVLVDPFRNVHVHRLLAELLGVRAPGSAGSLDSVSGVLAGSTSAAGRPAGWPRAPAAPARSSGAPALR